MSMSAITRTLGVAAVLAFTALAGAAGAASDPAAVQFKPLQGVSLHLQTKHAVGYYLAENDVCHLTLVVGDEIKDDDVLPVLAPARFRASVEAGQQARFDTGEGTELQFSCAPGATAMTVVPLRQVAYSTPQK
jgi:hypothetical protein